MVVVQEGRGRAETCTTCCVGTGRPSSCSHKLGMSGSLCTSPLPEWSSSALSQSESSSAAAGSWKEKQGVSQ